MNLITIALELGLDLITVLVFILFFQSGMEGKGYVSRKYFLIVKFGM